MEKIYEDPLGRTEKTEIWDLDGAGSTPYSSVKTTFNGRDQATLIREYAGGSSSTTYQDTTFAFDGHGRLATKHVPEYNSSTNTTWTYNPDDTIATVTDPREAVISYKYGHIDDASSEYRALLTKVIYTSPNSTTIPDPTDVILTYDAAGNRTYMSDESGNLTYTYDELSRLKTETKNFADTLSSAPSGGYVLSYNYELTGGLKSMTGPFGHETNYSSDAVGRVTAVGNGTTSDAYASDVNYRSFGAIKSASLSTTDPIAISLTYDDALRAATYEADSEANSGELHKASYAYSKDGMLNTLDNQADAKFDQVNKYDFAGRLKVNNVGTSGVAIPFTQILSYDAFNNLTSRSNTTYGLDPVSFSATYSNNRKTAGGSSDSFDAAGNVVSSNQTGPSDVFARKFDVTGRQSRWEEYGPFGSTVRKGGETTFDGDGRPMKQAQLSQLFSGGTWGSWYAHAIDRYIYSSVTGQKVTSLWADGEHYRTHVYLGSARIADELNGGLLFNVTDPLSGSTRQTDATGATPAGDEEETRNELGGLEASIPHTEPPAMPAPNYAKGSYPGNAEGGCVDPDFGNPMPCSTAAAYQNYLTNLAYTLEQIRRRDNPREPRDPTTWTVRNGDTRAPNGLSRYDDWQWQTFPDDWIFADNQRHGHPGLTWAFLGRVDDREQWGWEVDFSQQRPPAIDPRLTPNLRDKVLGVLRKPNCTDIVQEVLLRLKARGEDYATMNFEELFDRVNYYTISDPKAGHTGAGATAWMDGKGRRYVFYAELTTNDPTTLSNKHVSNTIAELLHHAKRDGTYSDRDLDNAARDIMSLEDYATAVAEKKKLKRGDGFIGHNLVATYCQ